MCYYFKVYSNNKPLEVKGYKKNASGHPIFRLIIFELIANLILIFF